ncbi:hypothetical protein OKW30_001908 [Paraburkholderia sp. Clong3]|nr:hypothetical protein [Paraburkholderia sp. CI2]
MNFTPDEPLTGFSQVRSGRILTQRSSAWPCCALLPFAPSKRSFAETPHKIEFASLPVQDALKQVKGNGARKIAVFADPDCGYCKQLETTLEDVGNITVYTFLFPVLTPDSGLGAQGASDLVFCGPCDSMALLDAG